MIGWRQIAIEVRLVDVHEGDAAAGEELPGFVGVPGGVAELRRHRELTEREEEAVEPRAVLRRVVKGKGKLREDAAEPPRARERLHRLEEGLLFGGARRALVGEAAVELRGEGEPWVVLHAAGPVRRLAGRGDPVERGVDLVGVEERGHEAEPVEAPPGLLRVDDRVPVLVGPTRRADAHRNRGSLHGDQPLVGLGERTAFGRAGFAGCGARPLFEAAGCGGLPETTKW